MTPHPACAAARHGRATDARNHGCTCPAARAARRRQDKRSAAGAAGDPFVPAAGTRRRIYALFAVGFTLRAVADQFGMPAPTLHSYLTRTRVRASTATRVRTAYARMVRQPAPRDQYADMRRARAARRSLAPPWVWDGDLFNIDDPQADPAAAIATFGLAPPLRHLAMLDHAHAAALAEHPQRARALRLAYFHNRRADLADLAEAS